MAIGFNASSKCESKNANIIPQTFTNAICYGQTGSGKTTGFILPNIAERMRAGHGMLIYTYKENFDGMIKALALQNNRLNDVIEIGTPWSEGINLLKECSQDELKTWFDSMSDERDYWQTAAFSLLGSIVRALNVLHELSQKNKVIEYKEEASLARVADFCDVKSLKKLHNDILDWLKAMDSQKYLFENKSQEKFFALDEDVINNLIEAGKELSSENIEEELRCFGFDEPYDFYDESDEPRVNSDEPRVNADFFILDELVEAYEELKNYSTLEKTDSGTGNRAVMETLENYISYAKALTSLNKAEISIDQIVNSNKIVLVNVGIMGENLARLFNICFTGKLIARLRNASKLVPWTIFIDEAHKIITKECMPETSVCRESCFEYILCTQNKMLLAKALGIKGALIDNELSVVTQNIAYQLSFYDPLNPLCAGLETHEYTHLESSKYSKVKGKAEPIFLANDDIDKAWSIFTKNSCVFDKVFLNASTHELKYIKPLSAKTALAYYKNGSSKECKIMLKSKQDEAKQRAKNIIENRGNKR